MARADSTVRVNVLGDARSLQRAAGDSEKAVGGIGKAAKVAGGIIAGAFAADALLDFAQTALGEADRIGDATARLEAQLGDLSGPLIEAAGNMEKLGQSRQDVLELEARFTDLATAAELTDKQIAAGAASASEAAAALALLGLGGGDAATVLDLIGKAVGGSAKPLKELGISLSDTEVEARALADTGKDSAEALTDNELAAARLALIMEKLQPRIAAVTQGSGDLEQRQAELQARWETLTGKIGQGLEGPLTDLLEWILHGIDGWEAMSGAIRDVNQDLDRIEGQAGDVVRVLRELLRLISQVPFVPGAGLLGQFGTPGGNRPANNPPHPGVTVQVQGGSPEVIEQAVRNAIVHATGHGPLD